MEHISESTDQEMTSGNEFTSVGQIETLAHALWIARGCRLDRPRSISSRRNGA